jgi:curli biogenesis system outer membrane secretion channel CsgG
MKFLPHSFGGVAIAAALLASSAVSAQTLGGGGGPAGDAGQVEKCDAPKGTLAVVEPQYAVLQSLSRYGLQSPAAVIRLIIQQSNCFQIVERGAAMQNMAQERALASSGQLQGGQNVGQGQMVAADFILTPNVVFSDPNAGGVGGGIGDCWAAWGGEPPRSVRWPAGSSSRRRRRR